MSDQDKPKFTVVDKRRAAQEETASDVSSPTNPEQSDPTSPTTDEMQQSAEETGDPETETPDPSETTESQEHALPDPALLLSMAALHLETRDLVTALLAVFDGHAWRSLGLIASHATGEVKKDLPSAQQAIDCVQFLLSKVESNLSPTDRHDIHRRLSDLRMNYLSKLNEP